jgi:hypothetical protein
MTLPKFSFYAPPDRMNETLVSRLSQAEVKEERKDAGSACAVSDRISSVSKMSKASKSTTQTAR